jgi:hypothetical protein
MAIVGGRLRLNRVTGICLLSLLPFACLQASSCAPAALSSYTVAGFSCTIGGNTFSNFRATINVANLGGGIVQPSALSDITVLPGGTTSQSTFDLTASYLATSSVNVNDHLDLSFLFTAVADPAFAFRQLDAGVTDAVTTGGVNGGFVEYSSGVCLAGTYNLSMIPPCNTTEAGGVSSFVDATVLAASSTPFLLTTNLEVGSRFVVSMEAGALRISHSLSPPTPSRQPILRNRDKWPLPVRFCC